MLLHKLAEDIPEDYVPPQKLIADVGKMVSDARDACHTLRAWGGAKGRAGRWLDARARATALLFTTFMLVQHALDLRKGLL